MLFDMIAHLPGPAHAQIQVSHSFVSSALFQKASSYFTNYNSICKALIIYGSPQHEQKNRTFFSTFSTRASLSVVMFLSRSVNMLPIHA